MKTIMNAALTIMVALALTAVIVGCQSAPRGGGMAADEGFTLSGPRFSPRVRQGDLETVTVSINRERYFKQDVTLDVTTTGGIRVEPSRIVVGSGDSPDVQLRITAPMDASLGDYVVRVVGRPQTGASTSTDFKVKVSGR